MKLSEERRASGSASLHEGTLSKRNKARCAGGRQLRGFVDRATQKYLTRPGSEKARDLRRESEAVGMLAGFSRWGGFVVVVCAGDGVPPEYARSEAKRERPRDGHKNQTATRCSTQSRSTTFLSILNMVQ